ncbi:MAG TPA: methyltransferase domain-containing protein [Anaerolineales bacterium]|jgi:SAM-dependent methyltransferase
MASTPSNFTRGKGLLEPFLAQMRSRQANRLIPPHLRNGRILDIGCGSFPYFLAHTAFQEKFAVDRLALKRDDLSQLQIQFHALNLSLDPALPFDANFFDVVTLLAVVEHLNPNNTALLFSEIYRVLRPEGVVILTTPAAWSDGLLRRMARLNFVSAEEIDEHAFSYTLPLLGWHFGQAGFSMHKVKFGYFELMLNMWATAQK